MTTTPRRDHTYLLLLLRTYKRGVVLGLLWLLTVNGFEAVAPLLLKKVIDSLQITPTPLNTVLTLAATYLAVHLVQGAGRYGWRMALIRSSLWGGRDLRNLLARHVFRLSMRFFDKTRIGDLLSLAISDIDAIRMAVGAGILTFADALFFLLTVPTAMFFLNPQLASITLLPILLIPFSVFFHESRIHSRFERSQAALSELSAFTQEALSSQKITKSFAKEHLKIAEFESHGMSLLNLNLELSRIQASFGPSLDYLMSLGLVVLLWFGGNQAIQGTLTLGTLIAFQRYLQKMTWPMMALGMASTAYQRALASSRRLKAILQTTNEIPNPAAFSLAATPNWNVRGRIEFRNLNFRILKDLSLTIEAGEKIGILGKIGSGKTTFLSLIPKLYAVERGQLWIDEIDSVDWPITLLRRQIGYVSQQVFLFHSSVQDNILLSQSPNDSLTHSAQEAAQLAQATHFLNQIDALHLSGGQKQRVTLARALIRQPKILILDDALASVDAKTERQILEQLHNRPGRNTELIATHRISNLSGVDRILVLDQGRCLQLGTHSELLRDSRGLYASLYEQQSRTPLAEGVLL